MLRRLVVSNYRSLGEGVVLDCDPLTVLVGPNGSGKSNLADVVRFVADCAREGLSMALARRQGIGTLRRWGSSEIAIEIEVEDGVNRGLWKFVLAEEEGRAVVHREMASWSSTERPSPEQVEEVVARMRSMMSSIGSSFGASDPTNSGNFNEGLIRSIRDLRFYFEIVDGKRSDDSFPVDVHGQRDELVLPSLMPVLSGTMFRPLLNALLYNTIYSLFPNVLRHPQPPDPFWPMRDHGQNWATVLKKLSATAAKGELLAALGRITGDIDDYRVTEIGGFVIPEFRHGAADVATGRWFGAVQESDGTLRAAGLLSALLQQPSPPFIGIEEPELSLHPGAIPVLMDYVNEASRSRTQVLLTTQSPDLLDLVDIDAVRVVERRDGMTSVSRVEPSQRNAVRERLATASEVWRVEGLHGTNGLTGTDNNG